jgi:hypothetical protein
MTIITLDRQEKKSNSLIKIVILYCPLFHYYLFTPPPYIEMIEGVLDKHQTFIFRLLNKLKHVFLNNR